MTRNDPTTGKFKPGNPGRPKGSKNVRTRRWEEVGEVLVNEHADRFAAVLERLMSSDKMNEQVKGAELFLRALEFVHPKRKREGAPDPLDWSNLLR